MGIFNITSSKDLSEQAAMKNPVPKSTEIETTKGEEKNAAEPAVDQEEKTVKIEGPLSEVYTRALNLALSNEDLSDFVTDVSESEEDEMIENGLYVYCSDNNGLTPASGMIESHNRVRLALEKGNKVILVAESSGGLSGNYALACESANGMGAKVIKHRSVAVEQILAYIKG